MARFIHTADWQIGKPYLQIKDGQKRFKLQQERLNAINRIRDSVKRTSAQFVLVAGDLFDSPTPSIPTVAEVLQPIGEMNVPVLVIPGNHDHGALGTIWHNEIFKKYQKEIAPNLLILLDCQPIELAEAVIFPCPLLRNKNNIDPTRWLRNFDWSKTSITKPRIVLAHGSVYEFGPRDYALEKNTEKSYISNVINLEKLPNDQIDYIALGDWHSLKEINKKTYYSGTPEPDRFNQGETNQRGQILHVDLTRDHLPKIESISTGYIHWHNIVINFHSDNDIDKLRDKIKILTSDRVSRDLIRLEVSGNLSLAGHQKYELLKEDLNNKLLRLRIKGECQKAPEDEELEQLTRSIENPLIAHVANQLKEQLKEEEKENPISEKAQITRIALCELYQLAVRD
ncbi:metallophosphoesterase family protein [Prochlorococcus marinus]|uniref:metallophosphoesterase family protein n=1 Tax=Prochlorococcus marinus TaxID=1219 RepID=UPI0022B2B5A9|nr:DNA repair exonuclease [Prochlorococcus marinus]